MSATQRRCHGCRTWYDGRAKECPECDTPRHGHNSWLATASLNSNLYEQVRAADREKRIERSLR